ncbi:unnamed protein product [Cyclocybe aegerita]|uniref:Uncharacterized protein n=1 Tax=Cyclocybe aegerita TaxID=1973307 RepID=A0A8S0WCV2_CYCAE|nr:unnamed protein product [Cyclocybe aegerita]
MTRSKFEHFLKSGRPADENCGCDDCLASDGEDGFARRKAFPPGHGYDGLESEYNYFSDSDDGAYGYPFASGRVSPPESMASMEMECYKMEPDGHPEPEEIKQQFAEWKKGEEREKLPKNTVAPLLSVNGALRAATLQVLLDVLGVKRNKKTKVSIHKRFITLLRELRLYYRMSHTYPFLLNQPPVEEYSGPKTPFVEAYFTLMKAGAALYGYPSYESATKDPSFETSGRDKGYLDDLLNGPKNVESKIKQRVLRQRIVYRTYIHDMRLQTFLQIHSEHTKPINDMFNELFDMEEDSDNDNYDDDADNSDYSDDGDIKLKILKPGLCTLIKNCCILSILQKVAYLQDVPEFGEHEDLLSASCIAERLLERWKDRYMQAAKTPYVILSACNVDPAVG